MGDPLAAIANENNKLGLVLLQSKKFDEALNCFNDAIDFCTDNPDFYCNRGRCLFEMCRFNEAIRDARKSVVINVRCFKGYELHVKCLMATGDLKAIDPVLNSLEATGLDHRGYINSMRNLLQILLQRLNSFHEYSSNQEYDLALMTLNAVIVHSPHCISLILSKSSLLSHLKQYDEAELFAKQALSMDPNNHIALHILALCNIEKSAMNLNSNLQAKVSSNVSISSNETQQKRMEKMAELKSQASAAVTAKNYLKAYNLYSEAMYIDPSNDAENSKLYFNRSIVAAKLGKMNEAIDNCSVAIKLDSNYLKAYLRRAKLYSETEQFEACFNDYKKVVELDNNAEYVTLMERAKTQLRLSNMSAIKIPNSNQTAVGVNSIDRGATYLDFNQSFYV